VKVLKTRKGDVPLPAFFPVTTFGGKYPLDDLVRPYLPRLAPAVMVSYHYAKQQTKELPIPMFVDSGGFASLFSNARVVEEDGLGVLELVFEDRVERTTPEDVLRFQEERAEIGATLDFPIPPGMNTAEAERRQRLTIANAVWALENRRRQDLLLYASIQAWDAASATECATELAERPFDGFAIGGLVPRARDEELVLEVVKHVRERTTSKPLHVFGLGNPTVLKALRKLDVDSTDSSGYLKLAADGKEWTGKSESDPSPSERMSMALANCASSREAMC
jgi:helicase